MITGYFENYNVLIEGKSGLGTGSFSFIANKYRPHGKCVVHFKNGEIFDGCFLMGQPVSGKYFWNNNSSAHVEYPRFIDGKFYPIKFSNFKTDKMYKKEPNLNFKNGVYRIKDEMSDYYVVYENGVEIYNSNIENNINSTDEFLNNF